MSTKTTLLLSSNESTRIPISLASGKPVALRSLWGNASFSLSHNWLKHFVFPHFIPFLEHLAMQYRCLHTLLPRVGHHLQSLHSPKCHSRRLHIEQILIEISSNGKSLHHIAANNLESNSKFYSWITLTAFPPSFLSGFLPEKSLS